MTEQNKTLFQSFEAYLPFLGSHWNNIKKFAKYFSKLGISAVWLPPCCKNMHQFNMGYDVYDLYDLGEFRTPIFKRTRYGTKKGLERAISALHGYGISVYADVVLNHKAGGEACETIKAVKVNPQNRNEVLGEEIEISAWTKFDFPSRKEKYSNFKWRWSHFTGTDFDMKTMQWGIYKFSGKSWNSDVSNEYGNYDYLMHMDIDVSHPEVIEELEKWGVWFVKELDLDGFRLDAVKHISYTFYKNWVKAINKKSGKHLFTIGEYLGYNNEQFLKYIHNTDGLINLFDFTLHYRLYDVSCNENFDLRWLFYGTLVSFRPDKAITFVDNHDTQPGESFNSYVRDWFRPQAYAIILLRKEGIPCVFYPDLFGLRKPKKKPMNQIVNLMSARKLLAYGQQHDYFDCPDIAGWTREGCGEYPGSGLAVVLSIKSGGSKWMFIGKKFAGKNFTDLTRHINKTININQDGFGEFFVEAKSLSVWVLKN